MEFEITWKGTLEQTVRNVFGTCAAVKREEWTDAFTLIYRLCTARPDPYYERLYEALREFLRDYVRSVTQRLAETGETINNRADVTDCDPEQFHLSLKFLHDYAAEWRRFSTASDTLDNLFSYVNNHFVEHARLERIDVTNVCLDVYGDGEQPLVRVGKLCVLIWHAELLNDATIHTSLKRALSTVIASDRYIETARISIECISASPFALPPATAALSPSDFDAINATVRSLIETDLTVETADDPPCETPPQQEMNRNASSRRFVVPTPGDALLKTYRAICESVYFDETNNFFTRFAEMLINKPDPVASADYARVMLRLIDAEQKRAETVLDKSSVETALERARAVALTDRLDFLFSHVRTAIENGRVDELRTLFNLLRPIRTSPTGFERLVNAFQTHVERVGYADLCSLRSDDSQSDTTRKLAPRSSAEFVSRFVERLLELFTRLTDTFVRDTFASDQSFVAALDKAFNNLVNFRWSKLQQSAAENNAALGASASAMSVDESQPTVAGKAPAGFPLHCSSAEFLARYCDMLLRGTPTAPGQQRSEANPSEVDARLSQCVTLFRYVDDKDLFQKHYAKFLSRRLVTAPSAAGGGINMELEESMVNRLKQLCGFQYTHRFACMFKDVQVAKDMTVKFDGFVDNLKKTGSSTPAPAPAPGSETPRQEETERSLVGSPEDAQRAAELSFASSWYVLQANSWPIASVNIPTVLLPTPIQNSIQLFESFYRKTQSGRKLTWLPQYSTVELRFHVAKRSYLISMSAFHAAILWQFNTAESYSVNELRQLTSLSYNDLTACLRTLVDQKLLVLQAGLSTPVSSMQALVDSGDANEAEMEVDTPAISSSVAGTFSEESRFEMNAAYANKRAKFRLPLFVHKEAQQETSEMVRQRVDEDRKLCLQAAIVRVMKSKKVLRHTELINEILSIGKSLHFTPSVALIKRCIEILIEKQYLQRSPNSQDEYQYLA